MSEMTLVEALPRRTAVIRGRMQARDVPAFLGRTFEAVAAAVARQGTHVTGPPFAAYRMPGGGEFDVEAGFPVASTIVPDGPVVAGELPGGRTVEMVHIGPYEALAGAYRELQAWLGAHDLRPAPLMWEFYLTDPTDPAHRHEDGPRTLVVQPVAAAPAEASV